ncbi:serine/threonine-protein kinase [Amnibacterium sp.]|uniref:serine/threonine-protein kinase n=1 Tax=Amnibacterium sp. TaxID=1872496 RepID=UPI003F7C21D1
MSPVAVARRAVTGARPRRSAVRVPPRAPDVAPVALPMGTTIDDRYRIDGVLRTGAMAVLHTAFDRVLLRDVVVKLLPAERGVDRFGRPVESEARIAAALQHPHLMPVLDGRHVRMPDGRDGLAMIMERMAGGDLRDLIRRQPLAWQQTVRLGAGLADGLAQLHAAGWLHRDVKPANVLLGGTDPGQDLGARLGDFGAATSAHDAADGPLLGTAAYLSPEQVRGSAATDRSDVYALGLVLVETMTGRPEFSGSAEEAAFARLDRDVTLPDGLPAPVAHVLRTMTAQRPEDRPSAAGAARRLAALAPSAAPELAEVIR